MSRKSSIPQDANSVSMALMPDMHGRIPAPTTLPNSSATKGSRPETLWDRLRRGAFLLRATGPLPHTVPNAASGEPHPHVLYQMIATWLARRACEETHIKNPDKN